MLRGVFGFEERSLAGPLSEPGISHVVVTLDSGHLDIPLDEAAPGASARQSAESHLDETQPLISHSANHQSMDLLEPRLRLWTFGPSMADDEALSLARSFPHTLQTKSLPSPSTDGESGVVITWGTGRLWKSNMGRQHGWEGSTWFRFMRWIRWSFGMM